MIQLILSHRSLDRIESSCVSLPFFSDERPLRHQAALLDWRLNGRISHLIEQGRLSGQLGESILMPVKGRLKADTLFLFGLGERSQWNPHRAETLFEPWVKKLQKMGSEQWLLSFSELTEDFLTWRQCLRSFVNLLASDPDRYRRRLLLSENPKWVLEAKRRNMDFGLDVELGFDLADDAYLN